MTWNIRYGILNTEKNRMLTSNSGVSIWDTKRQARVIRDNEFGGESHLEIVRVTRIEQ